MGYIAKAYVKIPRESVQNLIMEICKLDYKNSAYHPCDVFWFIEDGYFYSREYTTELEEGVFIDCNAYTPSGTEEEAVRLFLTLAEMRKGIDTNSFVQWNDSIYLPNLPAIPAILKGSITKIMTMIGCDGKLYHRLSPLEVAEAFKEGRIEL